MRFLLPVLSNFALINAAGKSREFKTAQFNNFFSQWRFGLLHVYDFQLMD